MRNDSGSSEGLLPVESWNNKEEYFPICDMFAEQMINSKPDHLIAIIVNCDSMSPEIKPGNIVFADRSKKDLTADGIFIILYDGVIRMKLIQKLPQNRLHLSTLNEKYQHIELTHKQINSIDILARIVWIGAKI